MSSSKGSYLLTPVLKLGDSYLAKLKTFEEWKVNKKRFDFVSFWKAGRDGNVLSAKSPK